MSWRTAVMVSMAAAVPAVQPPAAWREAPEFLPLFAPAGARAAAYRAYVPPASLDTALRRLEPGTLLMVLRYDFAEPT